MSEDIKRLQELSNENWKQANEIRFLRQYITNKRREVFWIMCLNYFFVIIILITAFQTLWGAE